jgi:hypothetical protein
MNDDWNAVLDGTLSRGHWACHSASRRCRMSSSRPGGHFWREVIEPPLGLARARSMTTRSALRADQTESWRVTRALEDDTQSL